MEMKIILNRTHLNSRGRGKEVNALGFTDFRVPMRLFQLAHKVLYIKGNRCRVLKERVPTSYSLMKVSNG